MRINAREKSYKSNSIAFDLINFLHTNESSLNISESNLYYDFPIFKDVDGDIVVSQILLISKNHGVLLISATDVSNADALNYENPIVTNALQLHSIVFSRLLRNKSLRRSVQVLKFPIQSIFFAPNLNSIDEVEEIEVITNFNSLEEFLIRNEIDEIDNNLFEELSSTIEGAKGIIKPKSRGEFSIDKKKGLVASEIEREINAFDQFQKKAFLNEIIGPERIRGLAGSGKTVILALKAAITHLRFPDANIVYTFYTKSLYQHIQRLITRFYRQYDDKDPNWDKLKIIHAWGGFSNPGIYYNATERHQAVFYSFSEAAARAKSDPFDFVCKNFLEQEGNIVPMYDYIFIDEGQDFPNSFLKLCLRLAKKGRIVWAYDELQTIFQAKTPDISEVLNGTEYKGFEEDVILYKCYRNPREILLTAHALGFGLYGKRIVQMIENKEYWNDIGYKVLEGDFKQGEKIVVERPIENSLETVSKYFDKNEIVKFKACKDYTEELAFTVENITKDIEDGLLPDDILVVVVDDRAANNYLTSIQKLLAENNIKSNNIHSDKFNLKDFNLVNHVTLSTIHKAKGNEAYSVHIVGIDSLYSLDPTIRERNLMFTAMTRAKGWVSLSGIGKNAWFWINEIEKAISKIPNLEFTYPNNEEIRIMKRDIKEKAIRKSKQAKMLDELLNEMSPEEIKQFLEQREVKKNKGK